MHVGGGYARLAGHDEAMSKKGGGGGGGEKGREGGREGERGRKGRTRVPGETTVYC